MCVLFIQLYVFMINKICIALSDDENDACYMFVHNVYRCTHIVYIWLCIPRVYLTNPIDAR